MELNKRDLRSIMYYEMLQGKNATECTKNMNSVLGENMVNIRVV